MNNVLEVGQTLDKNGNPVAGTGVVLKKNSPTAKLLFAQKTVLISNPITKEYGAEMQFRNDNGEVQIKGLGIIPPGCIGPPEHIHPSYDETFTVVEGSFDFLMNKKTKRVNEGETVIVPKGIPHTFKPADNSKVCSFLVTSDPPGKLQEVIRTVWALAHEGKTNSKGQPNEFWQGIAIGYELQDDTLFSAPPPFVQKIMFRLFGKTAVKKGYKGIYDEYVNDEYWMNKVNQIAFS
nr:cupin domain-containing protein [uncultured Flavobacterium sp.]